MLYNNEKMLPTSYSIAGWPQWLCITNDTVCCITTTIPGSHPAGLGIWQLNGVSGVHEAVLFVGLILRSAPTLRLQES